MSLQQRDCSGFAPDSLFIRRPEMVAQEGQTEQNVAKLLKNPICTTSFIDFYQENPSFSRTNVVLLGQCPEYPYLCIVIRNKRDLVFRYLAP